MYQRLQIYCITLFNMFGCICVTNYIVITLFVQYGLAFNRHLVSNAMKRIGQMRDESRITKATINENAINVINMLNLCSMYSQLNQCSASRFKVTWFRLLGLDYVSQCNLKAFSGTN
ncbi:hypothetical protein Csa_020530 [Cucumis sativus]|uniref:Uncharacterized protein n=1 Tax=Cucumis sativus TaxID=3659 RepID=A0A0A0K143_CUCSA|nr:hypothetical protein Csa_020530 [Cucumis sativus]